MVEDEFRFSARVVVFLIFKEASLRFCRSALGWVGPLDATCFFDMVMISNAGDVAGLSLSEGLHGLKGIVRGRKLFEKIAVTPPVRKGLDDAEVSESLPGSFFHLANGAETSLRVDEGSILFTPACSREHKVRHLSCFRALIHVLHYEEVELFADAGEVVLCNPRMVRVGGDDPEPFDFTAVNCINDLIIGIAGLLLDTFFVYAHDATDLFPVIWIRKVMSSEEVCRI